MPAALKARCFQADVQVLQGHLRQAAESYHRAVPVAEEWDVQTSPVMCLVYAGLVEIHREWNELNVAADYARKCQSVQPHCDNTII